MDLNKLCTFLIAAETKDMQATARRIFRTQPAVTQQIKNLGKDLGMQLFEKKGKRLILTNQGEQLYQHIREPVKALQNSLEEVLNHDSQVSGIIRIGILSDHAGSCGVFEPIATFCSQNPRVDVQIRLGTSQELEPLFLENRLDFGMLIYLAHSELFNRIPLAPTTHLPVCSSIYLKERKPIRKCADLMEIDLIDQDQAWWSWGIWFQEHFSKSLPALHQRIPRLTVPSYPAMKDVVSKGFGAAVLPEYLVHKELEAGSLKRLFPRKKSLQFHLDLVHRKSKRLRQCEHSLLNHLCNHFNLKNAVEQ